MSVKSKTSSLSTNEDNKNGKVKKVGFHQQKNFKGGKPGEVSQGTSTTTFLELEEELFDPKLLATVNQKKGKSNRPVSRRTKIQQNQLEQLLLAKTRTYQAINYLTRKTHFDSEQVRALLEIFKCIQSMGKMDRKRFRETLHNTLGLTDDVMLDRIFYSFDGDNEGTVSESEWVIGLSVILRGTLDEQIAFCYQVYDVNADQAIGRDELHTCLRGCLHQIPGHDEEIDIEEGTRELVEIAMKKLDLDRDGVIKYKDFHKAVQNDPILLQSVGECLPNNKAMTTFIALFDTETRRFSNFLSHPADTSWERENNKFNPVAAKKIRDKYRILQNQTDAQYKSVFHRNSKASKRKNRRSTVN